jgi:hypothetical protein
VTAEREAPGFADLAAACLPPRWAEALSLHRELGRLLAPGGPRPRLVNADGDSLHMLEPSAFTELLAQMRERDEGWGDESCQLPPPPPASDWPDGHKLPLPSELSAAETDAAVSSLPRSGVEILPGYLSFGTGRALMVLKAGASAEYLARGWLGRIWWDGANGRYGVVVRFAGSPVDVMYAPSLSELIDTVCGTYGWD